MIGILGGMGPLASTYFHQHIINLTSADKDQDHVSIIHFSLPKFIDDRTNYLLKLDDSNQETSDIDDDFDEKTEELDNPGMQVAALARVISDCAKSLQSQMIVCVPCNTFHSPAIFTPFRSEINRINDSLDGKDNGRLKWLNMIELTLNDIESNYLGHSTNRNIGILSTTGTRMTRVYNNVALRNKNNVNIKYVKEEDQKWVNDAIYNEKDGIKKLSRASKRVRAVLESYVLQLRDEFNCNIVILGCTELPIVFPEEEVFGVTLVDPMVVMAKHAIGVVQRHDLVMETEEEAKQEPEMNCMKNEEKDVDAGVTNTANGMMEMTRIETRTMESVKETRSKLASDTSSFSFMLVAVIGALVAYSSMMSTFLFRS